MNDRDKDSKRWQEKINERIIREDLPVHRDSYQVTEDNLDDDNPPSGGSGVPEKEDD